MPDLIDLELSFWSSCQALARCNLGHHEQTPFHIVLRNGQIRPNPDCGCLYGIAVYMTKTLLTLLLALKLASLSAGGEIAMAKEQLIADFAATSRERAAR
jgi:hypothetical protein